MRYVVIFFLSILSLKADETRLLISGLSLHEQPNNIMDKPYNSFSYGGGLEYNFFKAYNRAYIGTNILILHDSYYNTQYTLGSALAVRFNHDKIDTSIALAGFVGYKKLYKKNDESVGDGRYQIMGGVAPTFSLYYKTVNVNVMYFPSFEYKTTKMVGFMYVNFGVKL